MNFALRLILNRLSKSWTVWAGIAITILTSLPDVFQQIVDLVGAASPALAAQATALLMLLTRLRSIVLPVLKDLVGNKNGN